MRKIKSLLLLFVCAMSTLVVKGQDKVMRAAEYKQFKYEWSDAQGVKHEADITQKATDPNQIYELLRKVYCDGQIPGPLHSAYKGLNEPEDPVYYGKIEGGWNINAGDVTKPATNNQGYTILLVEVNDRLKHEANSKRLTRSYFDTKDQLITYIKNNIKSVELMTDGMRIGTGVKAGTVFTIDGTYNRFFFLSKGQARKKGSRVEERYGKHGGEQVPFMQMFEQFSPTSGAEGSEISDYYQKMIAGNPYPVLHDCASVIENEHFFSMSGNHGTEAKAMTGLNFFIPDYRLMKGTKGGRDVRDFNKESSWGRPYEWYAKYAKYNVDYLPQTMLYTVELKAKAEKTDTKVPETSTDAHYYKVTLDWESSLDRTAGKKVPQTFTIYRVETLDGEKKYVRVTTVENPTTANTTFFDKIPQDVSSYQLTYIIAAQPCAEDDQSYHYKFHETKSNEASVIIPGTDPKVFLELYIKGRNYSTYDAEREVNKYKNFIDAKETPDHQMRVYNIPDGKTLDLKVYRFANVGQGDMIPIPRADEEIATIRLSKELNSWRRTYTVNYEVSYKGTTPTEVETRGTLGRDYSGDAVIKFDNLHVCDVFEVSTKDNKHANNYQYRVYALDKSDNVNDPENAHSDAVEIPVYKTVYTLTGPYTKEQVNGDVNRNLKANVANADVDLNIKKDKAIYRYDLVRGKGSHISNEDIKNPISRMQQTEDGNYQALLFPGWTPGETYTFEDWQSDRNVIMLDKDYIQGSNLKYVPVICTFNSDGTQQGYNTYGADQTFVSLGSVDFVPHREMAGYEWNEGGVKYAYYTINLVATGKVNSQYSLYKYRAWRLCDDVKEKLESRKFRERTDYLFDEINTYEEKVNLGEKKQVIAGEDPNKHNDKVGTFGARKASAGNPLKVRVIVRLYYQKNISHSSASAPALNRYYANNYADEHSFYVVEKEMDIVFDGTVTAINDVQVSNPISKVLYYNALGKVSETPFEGMNIVVTTYADGTVETTKQIK